MTTAIQRQNMTAARITLLILFSCLICWVPASLTHLLFCPSGKTGKIRIWGICLFQFLATLVTRKTVIKNKDISWRINIIYTAVNLSALTKQYSGCAFSPTDVHPHAVFGLHLTINFLLISKSIINPVIFALRQRRVRKNLIRFLL